MQSKCLQRCQQMNTNKEPVELLAPWVKSLAKLLCTPVLDDERRNRSPELAQVSGFRILVLKLPAEPSLMRCLATVYRCSGAHSHNP